MLKDDTTTIQPRAIWDVQHAKWWFSVLDMVGVLNEEPDYTKVRNYFQPIIKSTIQLTKKRIMTKETAIKLFEEKQVRSVWDAGQEKWYISIVDVIGILTDSPNPRKYWSVLKTRLKAEGSQLATNCSQLKMQSADGKFYKTDVADTEQLFRLIQSIPSPKAEPFKLWLAQVASVYDFLRQENKGKKYMSVTAVHVWQQVHRISCVKKSGSNSKMKRTVKCVAGPLL